MITIVKDNKTKYLVALLIFLMLFIISINLSTNFCPDEYMRYDIPLYIYNHNALPLGNELELIDPIWGFSYGFTPYLPSLISVFFMKMVSLFSTSTTSLLVAARMTSVLSGTFTYLVCYRLGEEIFASKAKIYFFSLMLALLPQFVFISTYLNNDAFSVFTTALIVLMWIRGIKTNWSYRICVFLGIALGLCALTYYNAYGFILCSIFVYSISCYKAKMTFKQFMIKGLIIFICAFIIAGWFFIRNFIIHNGDFLGMNSMYECGEKYAIDKYKMSKRQTFQVMGYRYPLFNVSWVWYTIWSFFCTTGYSDVRANIYIIIVYLVIVFIGFIFGLLNRKQEKFILDKYFIFNLLLCMIIPIILSAHYSYTIDYQPQGRYLMSMLVPLMLIVTLGYDYLDKKLSKWTLFNKVSLSKIILGIYLLLFMVCLSKYFIPYFTKTII